MPFSYSQNADWLSSSRVAAAVWVSPSLRRHSSNRLGPFMSHHYSDSDKPVNEKLRHSDSRRRYREAVSKKTLSAAAYGQLLDLIRSMVKETNQGTVAGQLGVGQGFLSEVLSGKRKAGAKVLEGLMASNPLGLAKVLGAQVEVVQREPETFEEWAELLGIDPDSPDAEVLQTQFKDLRNRKQGLEFMAAEVRRRQAEAKGKTVPNRGASYEDVPTGKGALMVADSANEKKPKRGKGK